MYKNLKRVNYLKIVTLTSPGFFFREANLFLSSEWSLLLLWCHYPNRNDDLYRPVFSPWTRMEPFDDDEGFRARV